MLGLLVWLGRLYTGFNLSSSGYYADRCVISVKFNWPVFTLLMSMSQWICFQLGIIYADNGWISEKDFEANHLKRHEIWRQFSYLFVHADEDHLWGTLYYQLLIGCCLEIVNGWKAVLLVYFGGALVSDMVDFFAGSEIRACGAADAVNALYAAYLAMVILNWKDISAAKVRFYCLILSMLCTITAPFWYPILVDSGASSASNIGGALGGFVFGICLVKAFRKRLWKIKLKKNYFYVAMILLALDGLLQKLQTLEEQKRYLLSLASNT